MWVGQGGGGLDDTGPGSVLSILRSWLRELWGLVLSWCNLENVRGGFFVLITLVGRKSEIF